MDFSLPVEHRLMRDAVREFADAEIAPIAQAIEDERRFPREVFAGLGSIDAMGVTIPERHGGLGGDQLLFATVTEELGRVSGSVGLTYASHLGLAATQIERFGTEAHHERWLGRLARGEAIGTWAPPELDHDGDVACSITAAREDDGWVLNGTTPYVTNATVADCVVVPAATDPGTGTDGISTFLVDPAADDGYDVATVREEIGLNASPTGEVVLEDVRLPPKRLLGTPGDGRRQVEETLVVGRIGIAALSVGLARGAFETALDYASSREQFGRPIRELDAVRDMLVEMDRAIERARLLVQKAATRFDAGDDVTRSSSLAKLDAGEAARRVAEDAVQVLGAYGYTDDFAVQRFFRDAMLMEIREGTNELQRRIVGRELAR